MSWRMKITPFDQPNVESAKILARQMVAEYKESGKLPELNSNLETENYSIVT
jgi:glucose-6-phosphate isomerase